MKRSRMAACILGAVGGLGGALWIGATWIDSGPENTCGSVFTPGEWLGDGRCSGTMWARLVLAVLLFILALLSAEGAIVISRHRQDA